MQKIRHARALWLTGLGISLSFLTGCQTWIGGMTLPSKHYLEHVPQYFLPDPDFPLQRELATQEEINAMSEPGANRGWMAGAGVNAAPVAPPVPIAPPPR